MPNHTLHEAFLDALKTTDSGVFYCSERKAQEETFTGVVDWTRATIPKITSKSSDGQSHRRRPCVCGCWRLHSKDIKSERGEVQMSTTRRKHNVLWCLP